jgi:hypothetical protein
MGYRVTKSNEYKAVKNMIHNELKISKESMQEIISEIVRVEIEKCLEAKKEAYLTYAEDIINSYVKKLVNEAIDDKNNSYFHDFKNRVASKLSDETAKFIRQQLEISVNVKAPGIFTENVPEVPAKPFL